MLYIDYVVSDDCTNEDSFFEVCVKCGRCGRKFDEDGVLIEEDEKNEDK